MADYEIGRACRIHGTDIGAYSMYVGYSHITVWKEMTCSMHGSEEEGM
jgi:hypothetical protein